MVDLEPVLVYMYCQGPGLWAVVTVAFLCPWRPHPTDNLQYNALESVGIRFPIGFEHTHHFTLLIVVCVRPDIFVIGLYFFLPSSLHKKRFHLKC